MDVRNVGSENTYGIELARDGVQAALKVTLKSRIDQLITTKQRIVYRGILEDIARQ